MYVTKLREGAIRTRHYSSVQFGDDYRQQKFWQIALQKLYFSLSNEERSDLLIKLNELHRNEKIIDEMALLQNLICLNIQSASEVNYFDNECVHLAEPLRNQQIASHAIYTHLTNYSSESFQNRYPEISYEFNCHTSILKISQPLLTVCRNGSNELTLSLETKIEGNLVPHNIKFQIVNKEDAYLELPSFLTRNAINSIEFIKALKLDLVSHHDTRTVSQVAGSDTEIKMRIPILHNKEYILPVETVSTRICDVSLSINKLEKAITSIIHRKEFV
ncbi:hypothetical protein AB4148_00680 [Vibrio sp. 10N.286.51.F4]|uniref:hypothetical protein n=1 Tax=Vibrio sp. 10N.286.51.F4 TaxID=3229710 RepID=UPI003552E68B